MNDRSIIISIKPKYASQIMSGEKTIELRRKFGSVWSETTAFIYSTAPVKAIIGKVSINKVYRLPPENIWEKYHNNVGSVDVDEFYHYFQGKYYGYAIEVKDPTEWGDPISLAELKRKFDFHPPQAFMYVKKEMQEMLNAQR